ncbi:hypothetical protein VNO77_19239 [Canavalia gladiata]|uniref:U4/U6.U5 small nuclear ribonucleoprotein 27kDa protein domain-containing protein n=1 Tax=Canavalia gladiata TaxID=3824 RepID=A0AAN9LQL5_CANGL
MTVTMTERVARDPICVHQIVAALATCASLNIHVFPANSLTADAIIKRLPLNLQGSIIGETPQRTSIRRRKKWDELEMMKMLGIPIGFDSTKGKPVPGVDINGVRVVTKHQPKQYMNRRGGFYCFVAY